MTTIIILSVLIGVCMMQAVVNLIFDRMSIVILDISAAVIGTVVLIFKVCQI